MRLITALTVSALLVLAVVACAAECATTTTTTTPSGAGPTEVTGTTSTTETTTETTTTPSETVSPSETMPTTTTTTPSTSTSTTTTTTTTAPTPPTAVTARMMTPEVEQFNTNLVVSTFGVDRPSVASLRTAGWGWGDINMLAGVSSRTGQPILTVAQLRSQGMTWSDIGSRYSIASTDLTVPRMVPIGGGPSSYTTYASECAYDPIYYKTDRYGSPVLTRWDFQTFRKMGYSWEDIAVASNIAAETGASVRELLARTDRGETWGMVARSYNLRPRKVMDVSTFPYRGMPGTTVVTTTRTTEMVPTGTGPMYPNPVAPPPPTPSY